LGNFDSWIGKNDLPISGAAILLLDSTRPVGYIPHLVLLSIRFLPELARLAPAIVRYVEREAVVVTRK